MKKAALILLAAIAGCEDPQQEQDEYICEASFLRDRQWSRASPESPEPRELHRQFLSNAKEDPVWFARAGQGGFGSCTLGSCDKKFCYYHVQIYGKSEGKWAVTTEYDLAPSRVE